MVRLFVRAQRQALHVREEDCIFGVLGLAKDFASRSQGKEAEEGGEDVHSC